MIQLIFLFLFSKLCLLNKHDNSTQFIVDNSTLSPDFLDQMGMEGTIAFPTREMLQPLKHDFKWSEMFSGLDFILVGGGSFHDRTEIRFHEGKVKAK